MDKMFLTEKNERLKNLFSLMYFFGFVYLCSALFCFGKMYTPAIKAAKLFDYCV